MARKGSQAAASSMLLPDAVATFARPSTAESIHFPIDQLPAELIHMICAYLRPTELANLRLVSRLAVPISLQYMVPEVHLILAKESFEQLKVLSEHPIISKYVTSFFFEANKLHVAPRKSWKRCAQYSAHVNERGKLSSTPHHRYSRQELEHAFKKYCEFTNFQQDSTQVDRQEKEVAEAMKCFPNLKELTMATHWSLRSWTSKMQSTFEPALCIDYETDDPENDVSKPLGVQQMRSLLLGAYHAGLKVETLHCGLVSWRIFQQDTETLAQIRESLSNLKYLRLEFSTGGAGINGEFNLGTHFETEQCSLWLKRGRLKRFVTAAPNLEHLQISFQIIVFSCPCRLKDIVGERHWPSLKTAQFQMIRTTEDELVSFCSRHASTLRSLHLTELWLREGDWYHAFNRMRKVLTLDAIVLAGRFTWEGPELNFDPDSDDYFPELKELMESFFLGPCSNDKMHLEEYLDRFLSTGEDNSSESDTDDEI